MANTKTEQQVEAVVFKGQRSYMAYALGKFVQWGTQIDMIVVEDNITSIYVQGPSSAIKALHNALADEGQDNYLGTH